jgi:hypothetical protein
MAETWSRGGVQPLTSFANQMATTRVEVNASDGAAGACAHNNNLPGQVSGEIAACGNWCLSDCWRSAQAERASPWQPRGFPPVSTNQHCHGTNEIRYLQVRRTYEQKDLLALSEIHIKGHDSTINIKTRDSRITIVIKIRSTGNGI